MIWLIVRVAIFVAAIAAIATVAGFLADSPGRVALSIGGVDYPPLTLIEATLALLVLIAALFVLYRIVGLLVALLRFSLGDETALSRFWSRAKERRGFEAVSNAMIALAEGDARRAGVAARKAMRLLGRRPLTELVSAQVAEAAGDGASARRAYRALAKEPPTAIVGVKGLLAQAAARGEDDRALKLAEHAFAIRPKDAEVQRTLFDLQVRRRDWKGALRTLSALARSATLSADVAARRTAVVNLERARAAHEAGETAAAREAAEAALKGAPDLAPAAAFAARRHVEAGDTKRAARDLKAAWRLAPQPELAQAFAEIAPDETPSERRKRFRELIAANPDHEESRFLMAELALSDHDYSAARRALGTLPSDRPTHRALALMAAVEKGEGADESVVRGYLARAVTAPRGAHWVCDRCAAAPGAWSAVCPSCDGFDTLAWRETPETDAGLDGALLPLVLDDADDRAEEDRLDAEAAAEAVRESAEARA